VLGDVAWLLADGTKLLSLSSDTLKDEYEMRVKPRNVLIRCRDALAKTAK